MFGQRSMKMPSVSAHIRRVASPPVPGRCERHRAEIRDRLYRAALQLFADRGFLETTVADITEAADVGKGTFFNYFPTKEHVLATLAEIQIGRLNQGLAAARTGKSTYEVL